MTLSGAQSTGLAVGVTGLILSLLVAVLAIVVRCETRRQSRRDSLATMHAPLPQPVQYGLELPGWRGVGTIGSERVEEWVEQQGYRGISATVTAEPASGTNSQTSSQIQLIRPQPAMIYDPPQNHGENSTHQFSSTVQYDWYSDRAHSL